MAESYESRFKKKGDGLTLRPLEMDVAQGRAEKILQKYFPRISPSEFENYSPDVIARDTQEVERLKAIWAKSPDETPEGIIAEGFIFDMIGRSGWFGNTVSMVRTSEFDDYLNKIDALIQIRKDGGSALDHQHLGLGLDSTTNTFGLQKKMSAIMKRVVGSGAHAGTLGTVRYARTPDFMGELKRLPEVVLYIDRANFHDVINRWVIPNKIVRNGGDVKDLSEAESQRFNALVTHQLQLEFLMQIYAQLDEFSKLAAPAIKDKLLATRAVIFKLFQDRMVATGFPVKDFQTILNAPSVKCIRSVLEEVKVAHKGGRQVDSGV
jgi:hypothetical protein